MFTVYSEHEALASDSCNHNKQLLYTMVYSCCKLLYYVACAANKHIERIWQQLSHASYFHPCITCPH